MRTLWFLTALILVCSLVDIGLAFENEPEGFRGLKWGDPPGEEMELLYSAYSELDTLRYKRKGDKMKIGGAKLKNITYHYYENRFMMVVIAPKWADYDALEEVLRLKFGDPARHTYRAMFGDCKTEWEGDTAMIVLTRRVIYQFDKTQTYEGFLEIFSTEIHNEREEEFPLKREAQRPKREEERQKAAEQGLADF